MVMACPRRPGPFVIAFAEGKTEQALFEASVSVIVGAGDNTWFWRDRWLGGQSIASMAPELLLEVNQGSYSVPRDAAQ
jgi:hypothetical protein